MKKLVSLFLVLTQIVVVSAIPVFASTDEIIEENVEFSYPTDDDFGIVGTYEEPSEDAVVIPRSENEISLFAVSEFEKAYQWLYDHLSQHIYTSDDKKQLEILVYDSGYRIKYSELSSMMQRFLYENGQFMLSRRYGYSYDTYDDVEYIYSLKFNYYIEADTITTEMNKIDNQVKPFVDMLTSATKLKDYEKVLLVHDYICRRTKYYRTGSLASDYVHSMYGLFNYNTCVCQGYVEAMIYLLNKLDIPCYAVVCDEIDHVWNVVQVGGKWYHVDATWDDVYGTSNGIIIDSILYGNFLVSCSLSIATKQNKVSGFTYSSGSFVYPSGKVTDLKSNNTDFHSTTYAFRGLQYYLMSYTKDSVKKYETLIPHGFYYKDGRLAVDFETQSGLFDGTYTFEFDNAIAQDYMISIPKKNATDGYYYFISKTNVSDKEEKTGIDFIAKFTDGTDFYLQEFTTSPKLVAQKYKLSAIRDTTLISAIESADSVEFYNWGENMTPLACKVVYK